MSFQEPLEQYSRLKVLFRLILAIPILIVRYAMNILLQIGAVGAWFVIVFTGRMPRGLFDLMVLAELVHGAQRRLRAVDHRDLPAVPG